MTGDGTNDAPALAQADVAVAMNTGTQAAKEAGNMVDLDSDPTKLIDIVEIGKQLLITRGSLTTFSIANDVAKYFAIIPAMFAGRSLSVLDRLNVMELQTPAFGDPVRGHLQRAHHRDAHPAGAARREVPARRPQSHLLRRNLLIYGAGGVIAPFIGIKLIDILISALGVLVDATPNSSRRPVDDRLHAVSASATRCSSPGWHRSRACRTRPTARSSSATGRTSGSSLIGQAFVDKKGNPIPKYFQSRPSAAAGVDASTAAGYDPTLSSGSNLGPSNPRSSGSSRASTRSISTGTRPSQPVRSADDPYCVPDDKDGKAVVSPTADTKYKKNDDGSYVCDTNTVPQRTLAYRELNGLGRTTKVPVDAVTASASGLDPDISIANARLQAKRVATRAQPLVGAGVAS